MSAAAVVHYPCATGSQVKGDRKREKKRERERERERERKRERNRELSKARADEDFEER